MENSKALSPEVRSIIDKLGTQIAEYGEAFSILGREIEKLEHFHIELENIGERVQIESANIFIDLESKVNDTVSRLDSKSEVIMRIDSEWETIRELQAELSRLQDKLRVGLLELSQATETFRTKSDMELESTLNHIKMRLDKEIEAEIGKMEMHLALKLKNFDVKQQSLEHKTMTMNDSFIREINAQNEDIEIIKEKLLAHKMASDDVRKKFEASMQDQFEAMKIRLEQFEENRKKIDRMKEQNPEKENDYSKDIKDMRSALTRQNALFEELMKKSSGAMTSAIVGIAIAAVALILSIVK